MKNAIIYARVASPENAEAELGRQVRACESLAKERGLNIVAHFSERASGRDQARPEFNRMLRFLDEQPSTKIVVAESLARLSRSAGDLWRLNARGPSIRTVLDPDAEAFMEPVTAELKLSRPHP